MFRAIASLLGYKLITNEQFQQQQARLFETKTEELNACVEFLRHKSKAIHDCLSANKENIDVQIAGIEEQMHIE